MNRFVMILLENYDMYTPLVPHPIETELSREELLADMQTFWCNVMADKHANKPNWMTQYWKIPGSSENMLLFGDLSS